MYFLLKALQPVVTHFYSATGQHLQVLKSIMLNPSRQEHFFKSLLILHIWKKGEYNSLTFSVHDRFSSLSVYPHWLWYITEYVNTHHFNSPWWRPPAGRPVASLKRGQEHKPLTFWYFGHDWVGQKTLQTGWLTAGWLLPERTGKLN